MATKQTTIRLPEKLKEELEMYCEKNYRKQSEVMIAAIKQYISRNYY